MEYQIEALRVGSSRESSLITAEIGKLSSAVTQNTSALAHFESQIISRFQALGHIVDHSTRQMTDGLDQVRVTLDGLDHHNGGISPTTTGASFQNTEDDYNSPVIITAKPIRPKSTSCSKLWCHCVCHRPGVLTTPKFLSDMLGSLFIGYSDIPHLTPQCNVSACNKRRRLLV
jgi:hypothetical protein